MTKEELERIKQAYYSGLKVQVWFNGHWENFNARDYSMYPDPFSENRQYRVVGSAYADIAEKRIGELEKENAELKEEIKHFNPCSEWDDVAHDCEFRHYAMEYGSKLSAAKELLKKLYNETRGYINDQGFDIKILAEAEQFLKERE